MKRFLLPALLILTFLLAACSATSTPLQTSPQPDSVSTDAAASSGDLKRSDGQGSVTVEVTPLNLNAPANTLEFDIVMDTHSVELSMDLATLATLTTDTGVTVQATLWDAPRGGHHVEGKLLFPASNDGKSVLEGAGKLMLTITDLDAPSRVFEWQLQ